MIKVDKGEITISGNEAVVLAELMLLLENIESVVLTKSMIMKVTKVETLEDLIAHFRKIKPSENVEKTQELKDLVKEIIEDLNKIEG